MSRKICEEICKFLNFGAHIKIQIEWKDDKTSKFENISEYLLNQSRSYRLVIQMVVVRFIVFAIAVIIPIGFHLVYVKDQFSEDGRDLA